MHIIRTFADWWNRLAKGNGKLKFSTQKEAADFVRRVQNETGGPNAKMMEMHRAYVDVVRVRRERETARPINS